MLFNSYQFIFLFLPISLLGFYLLTKYNLKKTSVLWLVSASLFFYSWWNPSYLLLIVFSIVFNYFLGELLHKRRNFYVLSFGVVGNLALLGYFKYGNFFVNNLNIIFEQDIILQNIILPIAISFFTFQQIAYLVDSYRGESKSTDFLNYCLFVTFFPQLISGPIVHHKEMLPQFNNMNLFNFKIRNLVIGISIFSIGLFKKCIIADGIAVYSTPVFDAAYQGNTISFFEAWGGALAYSFQLYFDFSGYSEMALGLARMFGIIIPINFFSPYKANSIIDFWRRWHITLSRFLRVYLYIPLGGNRKGTSRRFMNLFITMLLGGLWHGSSWNFVLWGAIHGIYLIINHAWNFMVKRLFGFKLVKSHFNFSRLLTFLAVVFAWVIFRAENLESALIIYKGMLAMNGISVPHQLIDQVTFVNNFFPFLDLKAEGLGSFGSPLGFIFILILLLVVWFLPNTIEIMKNEVKYNNFSHNHNKRLFRLFTWKPNINWAILLSITAALSIMSLNSVSEFLYFQF